MNATQRVRGEALSLAFLVYREERDGSWVARSVLTGHIAQSTSTAGAIENLTRTINAAIYAARRAGLTATEWFSAQVPDDARYLTLFARLVSEGQCSRERLELRSAECTLETSIVGKAA